MLKMKIKSIIAIVFFLFANVALAQSDEIKKIFEPTETDSLYILAIENYTKQLDTLYKQNQFREKPSKIIYLQSESYLIRIPKTINGHQIIRIGLANQKEHFRKNKNRLTLVEISPLTLKDGLFSITLVPYGAKLKGKFKMDLSYSGYDTTYFKYVEGKLVIHKYETGGI
jgi:hypothetical protein